MLFIHLCCFRSRFYSEEELFENSTLVVEAEVVASTCLTYSIDDQGVEDILYEATLMIHDMSKGEISDSEVTLYSEFNHLSTIDGTKLLLVGHSTSSWRKRNISLDQQ